MEQRDYVAEGYGIEDCYEDTGGLPHHDAVDGCGENIVHSKCAGCTYEQDALSAYPCNDCWNGDGDGERCYYDGPAIPVSSKPFSEDFKEHLARIQNVIAECDKYNPKKHISVSAAEYHNLQAIAHIAKNVIMWYLVVAEGGRVNEIESLISSVQRWESEKD